MARHAPPKPALARPERRSRKCGHGPRRLIALHILRRWWPVHAAPGQSSWQGVKPAPDRFSHILWAQRRARRQGHHARGDGEQVLHPVIEFPQEQRLLLLGVSSFADIEEGADRPLKFPATQHRTQPVLDREARSVAPEEDFAFHMGGLPGLGMIWNRPPTPAGRSGSRVTTRFASVGSNRDSRSVTVSSAFAACRRSVAIRPGPPDRGPSSPACSTRRTSCPPCRRWYPGRIGSASPFWSTVSLCRTGLRTWLATAGVLSG
jgi:hypothetical protein